MVGCTTSALVCTSCTRPVQEITAIGWVVLETAEILGLIICAQFSCTPRVQKVHTKAEIVHFTPGLLGLGVLFNCHA